ncbi:MAG TPA: alpha/beta hydrolase [Syntrophales bacterium]|nr:alpha/beta hydrolase [Syntrophales bacterium]
MDISHYTVRGVGPELMNQDIGDGLLPYLLYDAPGPTVILLHATGFTPWLWHPVARKLYPSCRVIAPYMCDYRKEDPEKGGLGWGKIAKDIATLVASIGIVDAYLVGHSMGATVSMIANVAFGVKARGMVLIEPILLPDDFYRVKLTVNDHPLASLAMKRRNYWKNKKEALDYLRSRDLFKKWNDEVLDLYVAHGMEPRVGGGLQLACKPEMEAALFMGGAEYNPWPVVSKVSCPALVAEGDKSETRNFVDFKKIFSLLPAASHTVVEDAGHLVPMEQPAATARIIMDFISRIEKL